MNTRYYWEKNLQHAIIFIIIIIINIIVIIIIILRRMNMYLPTGVRFHLPKMSLMMMMMMMINYILSSRPTNKGCHCDDNTFVWHDSRLNLSVKWGTQLLKQHLTCAIYYQRPDVYIYIYIYIYIVLSVVPAVTNLSVKYQNSVKCFNGCIRYHEDTKQLVNLGSIRSFVFQMYFFLNYTNRYTTKLMYILITFVVSDYPKKAD